MIHSRRSNWQAGGQSILTVHVAATAPTPFGPAVPAPTKEAAAADMKSRSSVAGWDDGTDGRKATARGRERGCTRSARTPAAEGGAAGALW